MTETQRAAMQKALEALEYGQHSIKQVGEYQWESRGDLAITALRAALSEPEPEPEAGPVADPFADIRGKRMGELNDEQADRARERCLRDQIDPRESYWYPHLQALFRIIDRLRAERDALLKALVDLMPLADFGASEQSPPYADDHLLLAAQAAIAKATGGNDE